MTQEIDLTDDDIIEKFMQVYKKHVEDLTEAIRKAEDDQ